MLTGNIKMQKRITRSQYYMDLAKQAAKRATCTRAKVGSILVPKNSTVAISGFCGSPIKVPHCEDIGCVKLEGHCILTVHSEVNAVLQAASLGIPTEGSTLYVTHLPCINCLKTLVNSKVSTIYFQKFYPYKTKAEKKVFNLILECCNIQLKFYKNNLKINSYEELLKCHL